MLLFLPCLTNRMDATVTPPPIHGVIIVQDKVMNTDCTNYLCNITLEVLFIYILFYIFKCLKKTHCTYKKQDNYSHVPNKKSSLCLNSYIFTFLGPLLVDK